MTGTRHVLVVSGSRSIADVGLVEEAVRSAIRACAERGIVIRTLRHGGAMGVDSAAGTVAARLGLRVDVCPADWRRYGKRAGIVRNAEMIGRSDVAALCAVWDGRSPGTKHAIEFARKREVLTVLAAPDGSFAEFDEVAT